MLEDEAVWLPGRRGPDGPDARECRTMSREKGQRHAANHERWLVSYADFITLLFAFFVVLYASSQVDKRKVGRLALAIQVAFQEMGVFQASTTQIPLDAIPIRCRSARCRLSKTESASRALAASLRRQRVRSAAVAATENGDLAELQKELAPPSQQKSLAGKSPCTGSPTVWSSVCAR